MRAPKLEDVARLLGCLHVKKAEYQEIIDIFRQIEGPTLIKPVSDIADPLLWHYEMTASRIFEWAPTLVPDRLQTADYAQAILDNSIFGEDEVSRYSLARATRPDIVTGTLPGIFTFILGEPALKSITDPPRVMIEQLHYLKKISDLPHIEVQVVRGDASTNVIPPFSVYESNRSGTTTIIHQNAHDVVYDAEPQSAIRYLATVKAIRAAADNYSDFAPRINTTIK